MNIAGLLISILQIFSFILFARALMSWFDPGMQSTIGRALYDITEPVVAPVRQVVPRMGGLDLSIMVTIFLIIILQRVIASAL